MNVRSVKMAAPKETCSTSKQLLYSEKFESSLEEKLRVVGKNSRKEEGPRKTFRLPASSVLDRVQTFLPKMATADEELRTKPASELSVMNIEIEDPEHSGPMIQMDFALAPHTLSSEEDSDEDDSDEEDRDRDCNTTSSEMELGKLCEVQPHQSDIELPQKRKLSALE